MPNQLLPNQHRVEGADLEALLDRVRAEFGERARIVAADRVRRGGVGGFFAKETFEVVIESEAGPATADQDPALRPAWDRRRNGGSARRRDKSAAPVEEQVVEATADPVAAPRSVLDLVDSLNDEERHHNVVDLGSLEALPVTAIEPQLSTEREPFTSILERISADVGLAAPPVTVAESVAPIETISPLSVAHEIAADEITIVDDPPEPLAPAKQPVPPAPLAQVQTVPKTAPRLSRETRELELIERPENALSKLGLPKRYIPRGCSAVNVRGALLESLATLPAPDQLPEARGVVIAVVGVGSRPLALARALSSERDLDPDNLVFATKDELVEGIPSWLQINDAPTADERRRSWRRREHATVVAVSLGDTYSSNDWARGMLDHLEPTQVWAIADASSKPEDIGAWAQQLGGLDVLALDHLDQTTSPAAALTLDIPVGRLDGMPASPLRWAELLLDRMA